MTHAQLQTEFFLGESNIQLRDLLLQGYTRSLFFDLIRVFDLYKIVALLAFV